LSAQDRSPRSLSVPRADPDDDLEPRSLGRAAPIETIGTREEEGKSPSMRASRCNSVENRAGGLDGTDRHGCCSCGTGVLVPLKPTSARNPERRAGKQDGDLALKAMAKDHLAERTQAKNPPEQSAGISQLPSRRASLGLRWTLSHPIHRRHPARRRSATSAWPWMSAQKLQNRLSRMRSRRCSPAAKASSPIFRLHNDV